jgi:hypothetical protein
VILYPSCTAIANIGVVLLAKPRAIVCMACSLLSFHRKLSQSNLVLPKMFNRGLCMYQMYMSYVLTFFSTKEFSHPLISSLL